MTWKEIGPYRDHILWVRELPNEGWLVAMVPARAAAAQHAPPPEERDFARKLFVAEGG